MTAPKVSVSIITYNQVDYIAQAIDSALAQKTDFDVEIWIGDDCSTDGAREILRDYQRRHPDRIFLNLLPQKGKGVPGRENNITTLRSCRGDYIAMLDGDDWWTDPSKLQRQADILDREPHLSACFHDTYIYYDDLQEFDDRTKAARNLEGAASVSMDISTDSECWPSLIHTSSVCFRRRMLPQFPAWFLEIPGADHALWCMLSQRGNFRYIGLAMCTYRISKSGEFSRLTPKEKNSFLLKTRETIWENFPEFRTRKTNRRISVLRSKAFFLEGHYAKALSKSLDTIVTYPELVTRMLKKLL